MKKSLQVFFGVLIAGAIGIGGAIGGAKFPEYSTSYLYGLILVGVAIICTFIGYSSSNNKEKKKKKDVKSNSNSDSDPREKLTIKAPKENGSNFYGDVYSHSDKG